MAEGAEKLTEEEAAAPLETFIKADEAVSKKLTETRKFVTERQKGPQDNAGQAQTIKTLLSRLQEAQNKLSKAKKATAEHSKRYQAKRVLVELAEKLEGLKPIVTTATEACAPLLEKGGEDYLVGCSVRILATTLRAHMQEKGTSDEELFTAAAGGAPSMSEGAFVSYLA